MQHDRIKWNRKFRVQKYSDEPSEIVLKFAGIAGQGTALDIAAGNGRNALYLAQSGFSVEALDISDVGLKTFVGRHPMIRAACIDLDHYTLSRERYSLILNIRYLNRALIPQIGAALVPGGVLIFETYLKRPEFIPQRPFCSDHLLEVNELLRQFIALEVIFYRETITASSDEPYPLASLVAINR
jgi:SAM-dependent methyltransferase